VKKLIVALIIFLVPLTLFAEFGIGVTGCFLDEVVTFGPETPEPNFWLAGLDLRWKQSIFLLDISGLTHVYPSQEWNDIWVFVNAGLCLDLFFLRISAAPGLIVVPFYDYNIYETEGSWPWRLSGKINADVKFGRISAGLFADFWFFIDPELGLQSANLWFLGATVSYWL
jgi:hypothetical protein